MWKAGQGRDACARRQLATAHEQVKKLQTKRDWWEQQMLPDMDVPASMISMMSTDEASS